MGCDIHAVAEYRERADAPWKRIEGELPSAFDDRNYSVFSVMADVRNDDGLPPITEERGLPDDFVSRGDGSWLDSDEYEIDMHTRSWLSLADFDGYDFDQTIMPWIVLSERSYLTWRAEGGSAPRLGFRWAPGTAELTDDEYRAAEAAGTLPHGPRTVRVTWTAKVRDEVGPRLFEAIEWMRRYGDGENVRVVFGFDN